jgi:OOP family OmpA-OmpF porin
MKIACVAVCALLAVPLPVLAADALVNLPAPATPIGERMELLADTDVPVGPWRAGKVEAVSAEGRLMQNAWRLDGSGLSTLEVMNDLRAQLKAQRFDVLYECRTRSCGGFDFRFAIDVMPEPRMHVDLGDYRFLSARRDGGGMADFVTLMVSRSSAAGFVQLTHIAPPEMIEPKAVLSTRSAVAADGSVLLPTAYDRTPDQAGAPNLGPDQAPNDMTGLFAALEQGASVPLTDLTFETGSTRLGEGPFASLDALAAYMAAHPDRRVTLVGHSDTSGGLAENIALSKRRAASVVAALSRDYGIPAARLDAEGVGFLAPRAGNDTDDGRSLNRRVEALLTSLD